MPISLQMYWIWLSLSLHRYFFNYWPVGDKMSCFIIFSPLDDFVLLLVQQYLTVVFIKSFFLFQPLCCVLKWCRVTSLFDSITMTSFFRRNLTSYCCLYTNMCVYRQQQFALFFQKGPLFQVYLVSINRICLTVWY